MGKRRRPWSIGATAIALMLAIGGAEPTSGQERVDTALEAPRWGDRIAGVEIWRIPVLSATGRVIRENDALGQPKRCAVASRFEDRDDPRLAEIEYGFEFAPEASSDDGPDNRELRERAIMYLRVRFIDPRTQAPLRVARPIWHLRRPVADAAWAFLPMDGEGFLRAEAPLAGASDDTLGDVGADVASQTALITVELPSSRSVRIVNFIRGGLDIDQHWALSRCVCQTGEPELRYIGCRNVGWR